VLAERQHGPGEGGSAFLLGMCSCLDVILEQPMAAIVAELPLTARVADALLGRDNDARHLLNCAIAYERGDWHACLTSAKAAGVNHAWLAAAHAEALTWAHQLRGQPTKTQPH